MATAHRYSIEPVNPAAHNYEVTVTVEHDGQSFRGRGASVDIVEAGVRACLEVMNRILRREERGLSGPGDDGSARATI